MQRTARAFASFEEADNADRVFYASLAPQERLDMLLDLIARHREASGEAAERLARVCRVVELSRG